MLAGAKMTASVAAGVLAAYGIGRAWTAGFDREAFVGWLQSQFENPDWKTGVGLGISLFAAGALACGLRRRRKSHREEDA
jgi:hypothetical protein